MSIDKPTETGDIKDGFDLIEYPCAYGFKAMCRVDQTATQSIAELMRQLVLSHVAESALLELRVKQSRTGKYESVTISVRLVAREQLEAIYKSIAASPVVVMTL